MKKRFLIVLLTLFMVLMMLPTTAYADKSYCAICGKWVAVNYSNYKYFDAEFHQRSAYCQECGRNLADPCNKHNWSGTATCTSGQTCTVCGGTSNPLGHNYESSVTTEPTCTTDGVRTYVCKNDSSHTYTEPIPAVAHDWSSNWISDENNHWHKCNACTETTAVGKHIWNSGVITTSPTCTTAGEKTYTCSACERKKTEIISATGHNLEKVEKKDAGCTKDGYETYWKCNTCKKLFSDEAGTVEISNLIEIKATGHNLEKVAKKEANCTEAGYEAYWKCKACGKLFSDKGGTKEISNPIEIKATGHDLEKVAKKEASCTENGYEAYWKCKPCGKLFSDENGKTEIKESEEIKATGHSYGEATYKWSVDNQKCTAERKCTACGNVESETADATAKVVQEKNCTLPELTTYSATFKNDTFKHQTKENVQTADAIGHNLEKVAKKEASCTEAGHETYWRCQTCKKLFSDETGKTEISESIEIPALGHSLEKIEKKEAGCTESGYEAYWKCQICEKLFLDEAGTDEIVSLDDIQIPAKGHEEGNEWLSDAEKHWKECAVCQEKTEEADHVYVNETDTVCEICGYERTIKSEVPEILEGHNGKWQMNSGKTLSFRSSAPFAEFISVTIDDVVVDEKNYDKAEGSTIIILHPEFLSTLSVGTHTLSIDSVSGSAVTEFTIEEAAAEPSITETPSVTEAPSPTTAPSATTASTAATVTPAPTASPETKAPKTGDESNVAIWMLLLFLSAEGIIVALQKSKKKTR